MTVFLNSYAFTKDDRTYGHVWMYYVRAYVTRIDGTYYLIHFALIFRSGILLFVINKTEYSNLWLEFDEFTHSMVKNILFTDPFYLFSYLHVLV